MPDENEVEEMLSSYETTEAELIKELFESEEDD